MLIAFAGLSIPAARIPDFGALDLRYIGKYPSVLLKSEPSVKARLKNGKEVEGFAVLAQRQGAKAVLATLWAVADESTRLLVQRFYRLREAQPGTLKAEALRQAQLALLCGEDKAACSATNVQPLRPGMTETIVEQRFRPNPKAPYAHPYFWAPFVLIGNWK